MAHTSNPSYLGGRDQENRGLRPVWATKVRLYLKNTQHRAGGVAQVVECLPSKYKDLSSSPSTKKKNIYIYIYISPTLKKDWWNGSGRENLSRSMRP
jgi:hypothetical protein